MKIVRFAIDKRISYGILAADNQIHVLDGDVYNNSFAETGEKLLLRIAGAHRGDGSIDAQEIKW